jgi:hypothetical protein
MRLAVGRELSWILLAKNAATPHTYEPPLGLGEHPVLPLRARFWWAILPITERRGHLANTRPLGSLGRAAAGPHARRGPRSG